MILRERLTRSTQQHYTKLGANARCHLISLNGLPHLTQIGKSRSDLTNDLKNHNRTDVAYHRGHRSHQSSSSSTVMQCSRNSIALLTPSTPPMWMMSAWYSCHIQSPKPTYVSRSEPNSTWKMVPHSDFALQRQKPNYSTASPSPVRTKTRASHHILRSKYWVLLSPPDDRSRTWGYLSMNHSHSSITLQLQLPEETRFGEA